MTRVLVADCFTIKDRGLVVCLAFDGAVPGRWPPDAASLRTGDVLRIGERSWPIRAIETMGFRQTGAVLIKPMADDPMPTPGDVGTLEAVAT